MMGGRKTEDESPKPPTPASPRRTPEEIAASVARSERFQKATQGRGQPMTYGTGKPPSEKKADEKKARRR